MSISHHSGAKGLESLSCLKYNVLKRKNVLTLESNAGKNSDYMKKSLKLKFLRI